MSVLHILFDAGRPMSHGQLGEMPMAKEMNRVTLYRTLTTLQDAGLIHRVQGKNAVWHFCSHSPDANGCPGNHPHFLCMRCGEMRCLSDQPLPWVTVDEEEQVIGKQLVVYGHCSACAQDQESRKGRAGTRR
ncbi:MAG: transcriptional repressor [Thermoleophilia bacterium]|nr:transcriptional repressor [Thermoleophilia bacterium]